MFNYGGISEEFTRLDSSPIVVLPIPYDGTSTWIKGADMGPAAILEASANMELYDIETDSEVYLKGIHTAEPVHEASSPEAMTEEVYKRAKEYVNMNKFIVGLGGEHSVSFGVIKAYSEKYPDLTVLQLDAHADTREEYEHSKYNHACVMARAREVAKIVQVGIRSMDSTECARLDKTNVFFAHNIRKDNNWMDKVLAKLTKNVFITIDLDVFDPSIMPSTGTPEPGGLLWYETLELLKKVIHNTNVVGFDVVELCPNEYEKSSDFLTTKLIYRMLSEKFMVSL